MYFDEVGANMDSRDLLNAQLTRHPKQNGWPSVTSPSVQPNSPLAVADVPNEHVGACVTALHFLLMVVI